MHDTILNELDMNRYAAISAQLLPDCSVHMSTYDTDGHWLWSSDDVMRDSDIPFDVIRKNDERCTMTVMTDDSVIAVCPVRYLTDTILGFVVYQADTTPGNRLPATPRIGHIFTNVSYAIQGELAYIHEINNMALELGKRYDELTMLRSSDLNDDEVEENRHILSSYIRQCTEHLDIDYACIKIPSRNAYFPAGNAYDASNITNDTLLHETADISIELFDQGKTSIGINDIDDSPDIRDRFTAHKRILAIPLYDRRDLVIGTIACLNKLSSNEFTTSDSMTVEAVAKKVNKYIRNTSDTHSSLYNRSGFEEGVERLLRLKRTAHLAAININQFKVINSAYGVATGDELLRSVGNIIQNIISGNSFAARLQSDNFAIYIDERNSENAIRILDSISRAISETVFNSGQRHYSISVNTSLVEIDDSDTHLSDYLHLSKLALDTNRDSTKNDMIVFKSSNPALARRRQQLSLVEDIKHALEEDRFTLFAQNIRSLDGDNDHYEILVRMLDEHGDMVLPDSFIPTAENYGLMTKVDHWVFNHTLLVLEEHHFTESGSDIKWGINLSGSTMSNPDFLRAVSIGLQESPIHATNLYFEITETAAIENYDICDAFMKQIHSMGINFALDDFGSGLSSFAYLKKMSIDYLKIDGSLIKDIVDSKLDYTMVSAITQIADVLGVKTIAEYVENDSIIEVLNRLDIDYAQGYGICKPLPLHQVLESLSHDEPVALQQSARR